MSLSFIALQCAQLLAQAQTSQTLGPIKRTIEDTLVRFKIWAGNVGIFAPENASVDYRLRQDDEIVAVLTSILASLKTHLEQAVSTTIHEEAEDSVDATVVSQLSSTSSESSCSISLDSDASESALDARPTGTGAPAPIEALAKANDEIDRLYRLASVLRKPASSTENARVRDFIAKKVAANETEDMNDAEDHARSHLQARFPKAVPFLVDRLVSAVVFRRMQLRYRERHQGKLRQGVEQSFIPEAPRTTRLVGSRTVQQNPPALLSAAPSRSDHAPGLQAGPSVVWSATNASSVDRARYTKYAESAALSRITHSAVARRLKLDVPSPPRNLDQRLGKVSCSLCMRMISKEEAEEPRWTRHVLKDIKPYICLFPGCRHGDALFSSTEDWLGHLQWQHTIMWACQAAGHEDRIFGSEKELESHIRDGHPGSFAEDHLPHLITQGARPAPNTFAMLAMLLDSDEIEDSPTNPCPICREFQPSTQAHPDPGDSGDIQTHIMEHLESIALISLIGTDEEGAAVSNVKQSSQDSAEKKLSALELQSTISEIPGFVMEPDSYDSTYHAGHESYMPLEDVQHWREICRDIKMNFPEPEDDLVLLSWYERINPSSPPPRPKGPVWEQVKRWLFPSLSEEKFSSVHGIEGCADWFLAHEDVQKWCSGMPECRTLWLRGNAGCGKTVLSATVLEHLRRIEGGITLYYSFNGLSLAAQTLDKMRRTLILQLCSYDNRNAELVATLFSDKRDGEHQPATDSLDQALHKMLASEERIFILLDAWDECSPSCHALDGWLTSLIRVSRPNMRFLLISDTTPRWFGTLENLVDCRIEFDSRGTEAAMSTFIEAWLNDKSNFFTSQLPANLLEQIRTRVMESAALNFRTAKRSLESIAEVTTQSEVEEVLNLLPRPGRLTQQYVDFAANIKDLAVADDSMRLLHFMVHSKRPLNAMEVWDVLDTRPSVLESRSPQFHQQTRHGWGRGSSISTLLPGPLKISELEGGVYFSDPTIMGSLLDKPDFDPVQSNKTILKTCLAHLATAAIIIINDDNITKEQVQSRFPLTTYTKSHLMNHASESGIDQDVVQLLVDFFKNKVIFKVWSCLYEDIWPPSSQSLELLPSPLWYACLAGLFPVVQSLVSDGAPVDTGSAKLGTPLVAASQLEHIDIVQFLIEKGAKVDTDHVELETPLMAASRYGHLDIAFLLIAYGANINACGGFYGTALNSASRANHSSIVQLLIDEGADINLEGGEYGTALQAAAMYADTDLVRRLVFEGADVNAITSWSPYKTALHAACRLRRKDVAQLLVNSGADINLQPSQGDTAIATAVSTGDEDLIRYLISKGADVNAGGGAHCKALWKAPEKDWMNVLEILLDAGVDIDAQDQRHGDTTLHMATKRGVKSVVQFLLQRGADVNRKDKDDSTPLASASRLGRIEIWDLLKAAGGVE